MKYLIILLAVISFQAFASPIQDLKPVGKGTMKWFSLKIYDAELFSSTGQYSDQINKDLALKITYKRNISNDRLVDITQSEWDKLGVVYEPSWITAMKEIWPAVTKGDQLTVVVKDQSSRFYFNNQFIGSVDESGFGKTFLQIWLSPDTSAPKLRRALIGV